LSRKATNNLEKDHWIIDFETMGQDVLEMPVIDAAYHRFTWSRFTSRNPYTWSELIENISVSKADIKEQVSDYGYKYTKRDLEWWLGQGPEAKSKIKPSPNDLTLKDFCAKVMAHIEENEVGFWWSRGNSFDPVILHRIMRDTGNLERLNEALKFWLVKDTRTHIGAKFDYGMYDGFVPVPNTETWKEQFKGHISTHDVAADILRLQRIARAENDLPEVIME